MQLLLDRGYGAAGVAINSAPTEGVAGHPVVADQVDVPGLQEPRQPAPCRRPHTRAVALRVHEHVQRGGVAARCTSATTSRHRAAILWDNVLANFKPGHQDAWVDYKNDERAPLLFISGSEDHLMPPRCSDRTRSTTSRTRSPRSRSSRAARTSCPRRRAGKRSPTTRSTWAVEHAQVPARAAVRVTGSASRTSVGRRR